MSPSRFRARARALGLVLALAAPAALQPAICAAADFASPIARGTVSSVRLISAGPLMEGVYRAGVEITLDPKTVTYWRQPGEAGSPPVFDFAKSVNVAKVDTLFPVPRHIDEAGTVVAGYDETVIFPLTVTPKDPKAPVTLVLHLDYAACGNICLPAKADVSLALPQSGVSPFAAAIAAAEKRVPLKIGAAEGKRRLKLTKAGDGAWRLSVSGPAQDVFAEVPEPLFIESKREGGEFVLTLFSTDARTKAADATLTVVTEKGAYEAPVRLE